MAEKRADRRIQRTRQAVRSAFVELVLERGFDRLSVSDVAERANVGRSTFYAHFGSLEGLLRETLAHPSMPLVAILDADTTAAMVVPALEHFREQRRINKVFFAQPIRGIWTRRLAEMIEARLPPRRGALPASLVALQIAEGQVTLIVNWLGQRASTPASVIAEALVATTRANLASLTRDEAARAPA
jgi:AcrR family transcriptional regulator